MCTVKVLMFRDVCFGEMLDDVTRDTVIPVFCDIHEVSPTTALTTMHKSVVKVQVQKFENTDFESL